MSGNSFYNHFLFIFFTAALFFSEGLSKGVRIRCLSKAMDKQNTDDTMNIKDFLLSLDKGEGTCIVSILVNIGYTVFKENVPNLTS